MVFSEKISTLFPIKAEIPSLFSPAVTNGSFPSILSRLFNLFPLEALPNSFFSLNSPHSTLSNCLLSRVSTFPQLLL
jgi:hypothetical protein